MSAFAVAAATTIGSVHVRDHRVNQDAFRTHTDETGAVIVVADGHGHDLHFRSDVGSDLAAEAALALVRAALPGWANADAARAGAVEVAEQIVRRWRHDVAAHLAEHPFSGTEPGVVRSDALLAYGTTLLVVAATSTFVASWQIGDGDTVFVHAGSGADSAPEPVRPLPDDDELDGVHTSSLCQEDPLDDLRWAVADLSGSDHGVRLAYVCTDGFGKARVDPQWWHETGTQLFTLVEDNGAQWVGEQLEGWLAEPASVGGDDTTLALLVIKP